MQESIHIYVDTYRYRRTADTPLVQKSARADFFEKQHQQDLRYCIANYTNIFVPYMYVQYIIDKIGILLYLNNGGASPPGPERGLTENDTKLGAF